MTKQPEALRLADDLDRNCEMGWPDYDTQMGAAAELRRLHEVNQQLTTVSEELLEALKDAAMSKQTEALKLALDALEVATTPLANDRQEVLRAQAAIREALALVNEVDQEQPAQPQQEPVAWMDRYGELYKNVEQVLSTDIPLYPSPPAQRKPLTDEEINEFFQGMEPNNGFWLSFARAIEAAHGIKRLV